MSRRTIWLAVAVAAVILLGGCGSTGTFADRPTPATVVNLTVYVGDHRVSVSPASAGAGPVMFIVTNQASRNEAVEVRSSDGGRALATTGPINPGGTAQVEVDFHSGDYLLATQSGASAKPSIRPAMLHIGRPRPSSNNALLQP